MSEYILSEDLAVWFGNKKKKKGSSQPKGPWVNICKKKKGGGHPPCGRDDADKGGYPVCRGAGVAGKMSQKEKDSACRRKREKEKKDTQSGKGQKPTRIKVKNYKKKNESIERLVSLVLENEVSNVNDVSDVNVSSKVIKSICDSKKFCSAQGPITFGQLKSIVDSAKNKRLAKHIGEGGFKAFIRLMPWFIPQIAVAGMFTSAMRAANKLFGPTLKETPSYKSWWAKAIMKMFSFAEGDINPSDPFSKIFFISDGLMNLMNSENKLKFAYHISEIASTQPDDEPVPEFFVENELRSWINQRFLLDPPLQPKRLDSFDDVQLPLDNSDDESYDDSQDEPDLIDTGLIESVLKSYTKEKTVISEELKYHIDNSLSLTENVFRYGSPKYFDVINEARKLYSEGYHQWSEEEVELLESDRGRFFNYKGERLPFDFPMVNEQAFSWDGTYANEIDEQGADTSWSKDEDKITLQDILELTKDIKIINFPTKKLANIVLNWNDNPEEIERISQVEISSQYPILIMVDENGKIQWILDGNHRAQKALKSNSETIPAKLIKPSNLNPKSKKIFGLSESDYKGKDGNNDLNYNVLLGYTMEMSKSAWAESNKDINRIGALKELKMYYLDLRNNKTPMALSVPAEVAKKTVEKLVGELPNESLSSLEELGASLKTLSESEYKGKDVSLNKPKSGGPKKWYVYVKNPKTGKVIKVSYGSPVMTAKWNDPGARKSFAARHRCHMKKDKTKAGYWACRAHKDFGKNVSGRFW